MGRPTQIPETSELAPLLVAAGGVLGLAEATGLSRNTIRNIGTGARPPSSLAQRALNEYARKGRLRLPYPAKTKRLRAAAGGSP